MGFDRFFFSIILIFFLAACAGIHPVPEKETEKDLGLPTPEIIEKPNSEGQAFDSRMMASHNLTQKGYLLLKQNDFDGAIRLLERAVGINPSDGPGYFYLSEAWLGKKNFNLAKQFNGLALLYLRSNLSWTDRAHLQKKRIERGLNGL